MSAAVSSQASNSDESHLPAAAAAADVLVSAPHPDHDSSDSHRVDVDTPDAAVAMSASNIASATDQQLQSAHGSSPVPAPGSISEEGSSSSAQGDSADSADVVMEGTAEPEDAPRPDVAEDGAGDRRAAAEAGTADHAVTAPASSAAEGAHQSAMGTGGADNINRDAEEDSGDEDDEEDDDASQASEDYEHRFFLQRFHHDVSSPSEEELTEMERRKGDEVSALDQDYWVQHSFTHLASNSDPEYHILPQVHQLKWTMTPWHGTKTNPNRAPFTRSPTITVAKQDGSRFQFGLKVFPHGNDGSEMVSVYLECFPEGRAPDASNGSDNANTSSDSDSDWWELCAQVGCVAFNPCTPTVHASQKAAHQFTAINSDFGWTRFTGPWQEVHMRKHLEPVPLLQNDELSFIVYIRLVDDSTRALWWHNLQDHRNDWDPILKTGFRGYHVESQPTGYSALISALAVWLELPAFRQLVKSTPVPAPFEQPLDTYATLLVALKQLLHDKLAPKIAGAPNRRIAYLDGVHAALQKHGSPALLNPFEIWNAVESLIKTELREAAEKGRVLDQSCSAFFDSVKTIRYSIEPTLPSCPELVDESLASAADSVKAGPAAAPTSAQGVISLAKHEGPSTPAVLQVELPRQAYDPEKRRWRKSVSKIEINETVEYASHEYQLFGFISHSGELGNLRFNPVLRPRGPDTQWLRWSTRCNHTTRGYVVPQTYRQAVESHQGGSGSSSTVAYAIIYVRKDTLRGISEETPTRQANEVYNVMAPLPAPASDAPADFQVAVHLSKNFASHSHHIGFIDPWLDAKGDFMVRMGKSDTILDLRNSIRALEGYTDKQFTLYRLLLAKTNHRFDPQVTDERLENHVFVGREAREYGTHFLLHVLSDEHAALAEKQHKDIEVLGQADAARDILANCESIIAERQALHLASRTSPAQPNIPQPAPTQQEPQAEAQTATGTAAAVPGQQEQQSVPPPPPPPPALTDEDVVMGGTENQADTPTSSESITPIRADTPIPEHEPEGRQDGGSSTPAFEAVKPSQQLLDILNVAGRGTAVELISCMSEEGRNAVSNRINRDLWAAERLATFAVRYSGEARLHFFNLIPAGDPASTASPFAGATVAGFTLERVDSIAEIITLQEPRNHALVFPKHFYSKGPTLEAAGVLLVPRDSVVKEVLKRPNSTSDISCYLEQPGEAPLRLAGESSLAENNVATGCVLITDVVMQELLVTTLTKRGLPSSVTDYIKPKTGFTTGFGRGWADCEMQHGRAHGRGRIIYPNGDAYDGQLVSGRRQGKGSMFYASGNSYHGDWREDEPNGSGVIVYSSTKNRYEGPFKDGRPHGAGGRTYWQKAEAGSRICRICLEGEMNAALVPCGHLVVCVGCGEHLSDCPVCRTGIDRILRVYDCSQA